MGHFVPKSGSLIEMLKNFVFSIFRVSFAKNFLAAHGSTMGHFLPKSWSLFKFFGVFGAEKWVPYRFYPSPLSVGHPLPNRSLIYTFTYIFIREADWG